MRFISVLTIGMGLLTLQMHAPSRNGMGRAAGKPEATGKNCGDEEALATEPQRDQWRQELADETQPRALMSCTLATKEVTVGTPACTPTSREQQLSEAITPVLESKADDAKPSRSKKGRIHRPQAYSKLA